MKQLQYKNKEGNWVNIPNTAIADSKEWFGTQEEYDALGVYDDNTLYYII